MTKSPAKIRDLLAAMDYSFDNRPCVYFIHNLTSKNCYIGSTCNLPTRIRTHFSELLKSRHHCEPLQRAFSKYGVDVFVWGVCQFVDGDKDELLTLEQSWIDKIGDYNTCKVAGSVAGITMNLSDTERERRRVAGVKLSGSLTSEQITYALSKANSARAGKPLSEDQKQKLSHSTKGKPLKPEHVAKLTAINKSRVYTSDDLKARGQKIKAALASKSSEDISEWKANLSAAKTGVPSKKRGVPMSDESRQKMSVARKARVIEDSTKQKMSDIMKSKSPEWYIERARKIKITRAVNKANRQKV